MKKIGKKALFIALGVSLNLIDFARNDLNPDIYSIATALTGLVIFACILAKGKIKQYLDATSLAITIAMFAACVLTVKVFSAWLIPTVVWQTVLAIVNIWWIMIVGAKRLEEYLKERKENGNKKLDILVILWGIASLWVLIGKSDVIWPLWFFGMFILFYSTKYSKEEWYELWDGLITGSVWSFVVLGIALLPFRPILVTRYTGYYSNANGFASYLAIIFTLTLVKINMLLMKKKKFRVVFYGIVASVLLCLSFMTGCRTVWMIEALQTILFFVFVIKKRTKTWKMLLIFAASMAATVIMFFPTYYAVRYVPAVCPYSLHFWDEDRSEGYLSKDYYDASDYAEEKPYANIDEVLSDNLGRVFEMMEGVLNNSPFALKAKALEVVVSTEEVEWMPYSISVRYNLAKAYLSVTNLFGHERYEIDFVNDENEPQWHSQNFWIQITYWFGLPYGLLMFAVFVIAIKRNIVSFKNGDSNGLNILPLMYMVFYFLYGLMEASWLPGCMMLTLAFLVEHPLFYASMPKESKEKTE